MRHLTRNCGSDVLKNPYQMKKLKKTIVVVAMMLIACCQLPSAFAQGPGFDEDVEDTPVDGGVMLIAAAAVGYGVKKMSGKRKK